MIRMHDDDSMPEPVDQAAFTEALTLLLEVAHGNGLDLQRGWTCRTADPDAPNWEVSITRLAQSTTPEQSSDD